MRHLILLITFFYLLPEGYVAGQNLTQTIRGTVSDKDSKTPLFGANVIIQDVDPPLGTSTDENGNFRIVKVPIGRQRIRISYIGYKELVISDLIVNSAKEVVVNIEMEQLILEGKEVVIIAQQQKDKPLNEMSAVSTRTFTIEETNRYAGSWADPSRMAAFFAGVSNANDQRNDIIVRGNSPAGILWKMDGMEIPNPNHFSTSGTSGGAISILNNNLLENSDFMTGAFASEYGNALSGVFDLRMRRGNNEKREYTGQAGANGFELGAEGPFVQGKRSSYIASYRYSTLGVLGKLGFFDFIGAVPEYQDFSFKLHFPLKKGSVSVFGIGGLSHLEFKAESDTSKWKYDPSWFQKHEKVGSGMGASGISYMHFLSDNTYLRFTLLAAYSQSDYRRDSTDYSFNLHEKFYTSFGEGKVSGSFLINSKLTAQHTVRAGIIFSNLPYDFHNYSYEYNPSQEKHEILSYTGSSDLMQAYAHWKFRLSENLVLNTGFHSMYYFLNGSRSLEPRTSLKWSFLKNQSFSIGYGIHSRVLPAGVYFGEIEKTDGSRERLNKNLDFIHAAHYVISYDNLLSDNLRLKLEAYYQQLAKVPVSATRINYVSGLNAGADYENITSREELASKGTGRNYGVEATFEKFFSKGYYFLLTGSLFESKYKGSDGIERNTAFNTHYTYNILGGKEFKAGKNNVISISITAVNIGGRMVTPIDPDSSKASGKTVYIDSLAYSEKMKNYFRIDMRAGYRLNRSRFSHEMGLDIRNILNRKNIFDRYYDNYTNRIEFNYQIGFFPVLFYRVEF